MAAAISSEHSALLHAGLFISAVTPPPPSPLPVSRALSAQPGDEGCLPKRDLRLRTGLVRAWSPQTRSRTPSRVAALRVVHFRMVASRPLVTNTRGSSKCRRSVQGADPRRFRWASSLSPGKRCRASAELSSSVVYGSTGTPQSAQARHLTNERRHKRVHRMLPR